MQIVVKTIPAVVLAAILFMSCQTIEQPQKATRQGKVEAKVIPPPEWPLFHGNPSLTGYADTELPAKFDRLWKTSVGKMIGTTPVVGGRRIFCLHDMEKVTALTMDGTKLWTRAPDPNSGSTNIMDFSDSFYAPLMFAAETVIAASSTGTVYALDAANGKTRWQYAAGGKIIGTPGYVNVPTNRELVFVLLQDMGVVHAIDLATGKQAWISGETARCDGHMSVGNGRIVMGNCAAGFHVISTESGEIESFISLGGGSSQMAGGAALFKDVAYAGNRSGGMAAADLKEGKVLWMNADGQGELFSTPAVTEERVVFNSGDGKVVCVERATGKKIWAFEAKEGEQHSPVIARNKVVAAVGGTLYVLSLADGSKIWSSDIADLIRDPVVTSGMIIVATDDGQVLAFGAPKGEAK